MQSIKVNPAVAEHNVTIEICPDPDGSPVTRQSTEETAVKVDYSGASAKRDPAEIKLVRKLDMIIMVSTDTLIGECMTPGREVITATSPSSGS